MLVDCNEQIYCDFKLDSKMCFFLYEWNEMFQRNLLNLYEEKRNLLCLSLTKFWKKARMEMTVNEKEANFKLGICRNLSTDSEFRFGCLVVIKCKFLKCSSFVVSLPVPLPITHPSLGFATSLIGVV